MIQFTEIHFTQDFPGTLYAGPGQGPQSARALLPWLEMAGKRTHISWSPVCAFMNSRYWALAQGQALPLAFWHGLQRPFPLTFSLGVWEVSSWFSDLHSHWFSTYLGFLLEAQSGEFCKSGPQEVEIHHQAHIPI